MNNEKALKLLNAANIFFSPDKDDPEMAQTINLNDAFFWASSDGEYVPDDKLQEVARLFYLYGWAGIYYWVIEQNDYDNVEFKDVNRQIDFVRHEEKLTVDMPDSEERAYYKFVYTLGEE